MIDNDLHLGRLERSLRDSLFRLPSRAGRLPASQAELIARTACGTARSICRFSRGEADRDFLYSDALVPRFVGFTQAEDADRHEGSAGRHMVDLADDPRWSRRDIKTAMLLGQVMAKAGGARPRFRRRLAGGERAGDGGRILHGPCHHR